MPIRTPHIGSFFQNMADALSLTTAERRGLQFLLAGFIIGLGVKLTRELVASPTKFDYSASDSTFVALSGGADPAPPDARGADPAGQVNTGPVPMNSAGKADLMTLPGVGEVMAERIILERQDNGPFRTVEDLERVRGIGPKRIEQLRPLVIID